MVLGTLRNGTSVFLPLPDSATVFDESCAVLIAGLGTAGACAALLCAENLCMGHRVIGIERGRTMGGLAASGGIGIHGWGVPLSGARKKYAAACSELENTGAYTFKNNSGAVLSAVFEKEARKTGLSVRYETIIIGVYLETGTVVGVQTLCRGEIRRIRAAVVIDATGDACVSRMAGAQVQWGRNGDGDAMAMSKVLLQENPDGTVRTYSAQIAGAVPRSEACGPASEDETSAILRFSRYSPCKWTPERHPARVFALTPIPGLRETCHVVTDTVLRFRDCLLGKRYPDSLFSVTAPPDLVKMGDCYAFEGEDYVTYRTLCGMQRFAFRAVIPYGSLLPVGTEGLLITGKCFGCDHESAGGLRMTGFVACLAEAAAYAAVYAVQNNTALRDVPSDYLRKRLSDTGCPGTAELFSASEKQDTPNIGNLDSPSRPLHTYTLLDFSHPTGTEPGEPFPAVDLPDPEEAGQLIKKSCIYANGVIAAIQTEKAAETPDRVPLAYYAAWHCRLIAESGSETEKASVRRKNAYPEVFSKLLKDEPTVSCHAAVALGICGDSRALPYLRRIVRDPQHYAPSEAETYPDRIKAVCLLGRLGDLTDAELLLDLISDHFHSFCLDYLPTKAFPTPERYKKEAFLYTVAALISLVQKTGDDILRKRLSTAVEEYGPLKTGAFGIDRSTELLHYLHSVLYMTHTLPD